MKRIVALHPFLFAAYPVFSLFASNIGQLSYSVIVIPLAITLGCSVLLWLGLIFIFKDLHKSGFLVSLFLFLFFSYGHLNNTLKSLAILWPLIFIVGIYLTSKIKRSFFFPNLTRLLNIIGTILMLITLTQIGIFEFKTRQPSMDIPQKVVIANHLKDKSLEKDLPNIFFIILDSYARSDILKEIYDYDNTDFLKFLTQKGFFIAKQSMANYCTTALSLASCFNMNYIDDLIGKQVSLESDDRRPLYYLIQQNPVFRFLKKQGYSIVSLSFGKELTDIINADIRLEGLILNDFQNNLTNATPLPTLLKLLNITDLFDWYRKRILFILKNLVNVSKRKEPLFIFTYILVPHPPFVFGPNGEKRYFEEQLNDADGNRLIKEGRLTREQYIKGYRDQLIFINKQMKKVITEILSQSRQPPIILILGDHGPRSTLDWRTPDLTYMKECMSNLMAYYLPPKGTSYLNHETSPVNIFRTILNHYFNANYELLENKCYFSTLRYPYRFYDVTERVKNPNEWVLHFHLGLYYSTRQERLNDAIYHYSAMLRMRPDSPSIHNELGAILAVRGKTDEAIFHFREALKINPDFTPAHNNLIKALKIKQGKKN